MDFPRYAARLTALSLLFATRLAAAEVPADLGKSEVRCDDGGCALGACVVRELWAEPQRILDHARIIPNIEGGQATGFKLFAIRAGSLLAKLGLQNGDIVQRVNGYELKNPTTALAASEALRDAKEITIELLRRGEPVKRLLRADRRPLPAADCPPPPPSDAPKPAPPPADPSTRQSSVTPPNFAKDIVCSGKRCKLRNGVLDRILDSTIQLAQSARLVPVMKDGKPIGLKIFAIRPGTFFSYLLLRNGDLVQKVSGHEISAPEKALEAYSALRGAKTVELELERAGKPLTLTYEIER